jgi:WD40 repeat protein/serine/threonine protein kinase/DNA-binding XRE family transcriptional regulator
MSSVEPRGEASHSFGQLVKARRRELGLTQDELAHRVGCAPVTLRKVEYDDLRPSVQIAERLAMALNIPLEERAAFVRLARAQREPEPLTPTPRPEEIGTEDLTGRAIRGYALAERIGAGGMGAVYRAVQSVVEREVAIKIILPRYANQPDFIRRFEAEAQIVARLEHPHIVPLYDYWREPNVALLVMRLLRGGSLRQLLEKGRLPLDVVIRLLEQIGSALGVAHRAGVVHRDLKPANVMLDEDTNAYLADFGIARNLSDPNLHDQTQADASLGSPAYISPEQIRSEFVRPQTDIYALGVILYELLTGAIPFSGPTPIEIMHQHLSTPLPPLAANRAGLPKAWDNIIAHATAKDPLERYADVESLLNDVRAVSVGARPVVTTLQSASTRQRALTSEDNPYKGLRAFGEADTQDFFGREALVTQLLVRLSEGGDLARFLTVIGPSGSGKSSLVGAGLVPALRRGGLPGSENWFIVQMLPGPHPLEELEAALLRIAVNPPDSLLTQLREDKRGLLRAVRRCLPDDTSIELVLVIDQFEEVFTLVPDEAARAHLLDSLVTTVLDERSRVRVIVTLRADFIDRPLSYVDFGELLRQRSEFVLPLTPDELEQAIVRPAERVGLQLESGLASTIIGDVDNQPGTLPLLQYALTELFEKRADSTLTKATYQSIGGVLGALDRRAEEVYQGLSEPDQAAARQLCLRLVTLGEGVEDTRRRVLLAELEALNDASIQNPKSKIQNVLDVFGKHRLLTFDRDPITRGPTVEVAHEALLREWPRLREWLNESRAAVRMQRQLAAAAHEWHSANHDVSFLLTGARLAQFEGWAQGSAVALTRDERAFLEASVAEQERREAEEAARQRRELESERQTTMRLRRRNRIIAVAGGLALLLAVLAGMFGAQSNQNAAQAQAANRVADQQRAEAINAQATSVANAAAARQSEANALAQQRIATARELAATALANLGVDAQRSVLLALQAVKTTQEQDQLVLPEAEDALHRAVLASRAQLTIEPNGNQVWRAVYNRDGSQIATRVDGLIQLWDPRTGKEVWQIQIPSTAGFDTAGWDNVVFSSDGTQLAIVDYDSDDKSQLWARIYDAHSGELVRQTNIPMAVDEWSLSDFSSDLTKVVIGSYQNAAKVWDTRTGGLLQTLSGHQASVTAVAFSADGERIVTTSSDGSAKIWDAANGKELLNLCCHIQPIDGTAFSPDSTKIATASNDRTIKIWDATTGKERVTLSGLGDQVKNVAFSPDGKQVAGASFDRTALVWNSETGDPLYRLTGHTDVVQDARFSPDGKQLVTASWDGSAVVWDAGPSHEVAAISTSPIWRSATNQDHTRLATYNAESKFMLWDLARHQLLSTFTDPSAYQADILANIAISPDGRQVSYATPDAVKVWDIESGQQKFSLAPKTTDVQPSWVGGPTFSVAGKHILGNFDYSQDGQTLRRVLIWDAVSGAQLADFSLPKSEGTYGAIALSPDGTRLVAGDSSAAVRLFDAQTGEKLREEHNSGFVDYVLFSPDGQQYISANVDGTAVVRDTATGRMLFPALTNSATIYSIDYSADGKYIATAGLDGVAKVWDANTGQELHTLQGSSAQIRGAHFNADGTHLITTGMDGVIREYTLRIDELVELAKARLTRSWTTDECRRFLHIGQCPQ